eukprot:Platyproteum_vivax@DN6484_c0_g1_i2.p1
MKSHFSSQKIISAIFACLLLGAHVATSQNFMAPQTDDAAGFQNFEGIFSSRELTVTSIAPAPLVGETSHKPGAPNYQMTFGLKPFGESPAAKFLTLKAPNGYKFAAKCTEGVAQPLSTGPGITVTVGTSNFVAHGVRTNEAIRSCEPDPSDSTNETVKITF